MSPIARIALRAVVLITAVVAALWTWTAPGDADLYPARQGSGAVTVHVLNNGFHTDLAVPRAALEARPGPLASAVATLPPGDWVLIGWGDARFYVEQGPIGSRLPDGARAFLRPGGNASVLMLYPVAFDPRLAFPPERRRALRLSAEGFEAMHARIEASLVLVEGEARLAARRPGDDARFFVARGRFWVGNLCNHWTAQMLNAAGLPVRPLRAVTAGEIVAAIDRAELDTGGQRD